MSALAKTGHAAKRIPDTGLMFSKRLELAADGCQLSRKKVLYCLVVAGFSRKEAMQLTEQFLITEKGKFELSKILSVKLAEEEYLPVPVYPLLVLGLFLIVFLHPLCSLLCLIPAIWLTTCHKRKAPRAVVTVCIATATHVVKLSNKGQFKELEAAILKARSGSKP